MYSSLFVSSRHTQTMVTCTLLSGVVSLYSDSFADVVVTDIVQKKEEGRWTFLQVSLNITNVLVLNLSFFNLLRLLG